jgi:hypothetical protein
VGAENGADGGGLPATFDGDEKGPGAKAYQCAEKFDNDAKDASFRRGSFPISVAETTPQCANKEKVIVMRHSTPIRQNRLG